MKAFIKQVFTNFIGVFMASLSIYLITPNIPQDSGVRMYFDPVHNRFNDPAIAYHILKALETASTNPFSYSNYTITTKSGYHPHMLKYLPVDGEYCNRHRSYFVRHTDAIFNSQNIITDPRELNDTKNPNLTQVEIDLESSTRPNTGKLSAQKSLSLDAPNIHYFFTIESIHPYLYLGKDFACLTQAYNHIPSAGNLLGKGRESATLDKYILEHEDKQECLKSESVFPKAWMLAYPNQCKEFFSNLNSTEYLSVRTPNQIIYIKTGSLDEFSKNFFILDVEEDDQIRTVFQNGENCGKIDTNYVIQSYNSDPLLVDMYHFSVRAYLLIASVNPIIAYYHDGYIKATLTDLSFGDQPKTRVKINTIQTSQNRSTQEFKVMNAPYSEQWSFKRFENYLTKEGVVQDSNWLGNYLRPEIKKAMIHLVKMSKGHFFKSVAVYESFGVDFMVDYEFNLWFTECIPNPILHSSDPELKPFMKKMLKDHFEIIVGLTRSRIKRIITYVNSIMSEVESDNIFEGQIHIKNFDQKKKEFEKVIQNKWEKEFEVSKRNKYELIIDENFEGSERYAGLLSEDCS